MKIISYIIAILLFVSCGSKQEKQNEDLINPDKYLKDLEHANQYYTVSESDQIDDYATRMGWEMVKTGTGLRYLIYENGTGRKVEDKLVVRFEFKVNLLNGALCYDSDQSGPKEVWIGHADVESGLEEGLQLLKEGDHAKFIIPSHLAYGWLGDSDQIPTRAVLIYDVHVLEVRDYSPEIY
ncbi:MAG: FKBP-type peptidyl-prolyl cis-trans isomerase [Bacteroidales bacterium]|nr:FKBP-type peptidyl-prolyl cis-trans isomerase [Bacteroidales bacterium]